ncbi:efflux RND transporter periplasmic adaptor subunit [Flavimaricola marinus]|uniref:Multidrug resistance protein MdtE n=1 Tax=Flavimaricola marinus TaxID=1819565 RepID=A0A238LD00_9RHOB|nr:HlyD family efflux transporter periplasmic adaptor subunit [Flavimaricola marinus]SMY06816.1 Multidrug resistance protein MdtE precursor [Flavimaricola marinus]
MSFVRRILTGVFLMSLTLGLLAYAGSLVFGAVQARMNAEPRSFPQRETVIAVNVATVEPQRISPVLNVFGEVQSRRTVDLRAAVGGTVIAVGENFVEGGRVTQGEMLLQIDPADAESALARVEADLQDALAAERDAERALQLARDELSASEAQAALRATALQRQRDLQSRGIGTAPEIEAAELAASTAEQTVLSRRQAVTQAEAQIDQAATRTARVRIDLAEAQRTLDGTTILAAFDGTLTAVGVAEGGRVTGNEQVAQLIDPSALEVSFRVSTAQYSSLIGPDGRLQGLPVAVNLDVAGVDLTASGQISRDSATVGEGQTGRLIFASITDAPGFRPGDFVTVAVEQPPMDGVALIPATALASDMTVLVVGEGERLRSAEVELIARQGDDVLIRAPDLAGAQVVAARTPLLGAGIRVRPISPADLAASARGEPPPPPAMIALDDDRRARLVAFVEGNSRMPAEAKSRILSQLEQPEVPAEIVENIESRMGS